MDELAMKKLPQNFWTRVLYLHWQSIQKFP
jgi:hypothetical protein